MEDKKYNPTGQAIPASAAVSVSVSSESSPSELQNRSKARYVPPIYPYKPSRAERRQYIHAKLRGEQAWVKKSGRKQYEHNNSKDNSSISSILPLAPQSPSPQPQISPPGRQLSPPKNQLSPLKYRISPPGYHPSLPQSQPSPTVRPTSFTQIPPPPRLLPLMFTNPVGSPTEEAALHVAWWASISNALASYSARGYHLFIASSFLTCKIEELLLLYEVRRLNADGKMLFEEVIRGLRARIANWEGSIDELRISWDMESKKEMVVRYDAFVREQVGKLEKELSEGAEGSSNDDSETVINSRPSQDGCAVKDSSFETSPTAECRRSESEALHEEVVRKITIIEPEDRKDCAPPKRSLTSRSSFDWADDAIEAIQDEGQGAIEAHKKQEDSAILKSAAAVPSPIDITPPTWAKVLASPVKIQSVGADSVKGLNASTSNGWGFSGRAWDWERNWKG